VFAAAVAAASVLRHFVIEPEWIGHACAELAPPAWCAPRAALVTLFHLGAVGAASIALALAAWLRRNRQIALTALVGAGAGLVLYNFETAALALVVAALALAREHRRGAQHAQRAPG
jgi:3-oxoacyl-[acyl-carrier-protein] synthase III